MQYLLQQNLMRVLFHRSNINNNNYKVEIRNVITETKIQTDTQGIDGRSEQWLFYIYIFFFIGYFIFF